jgi:regulator of cell morphogenesis and NO signaling
VYKRQYEEEDTLFSYINLLLKIQKGEVSNPQMALWRHRKLSLKQIHTDHCEEDELAGIRNLVEEADMSDLHWRVIAQEIKAFDREMWYHAEIENKILFPRAVALEAVVREKVNNLTPLN